MCLPMLASLIPEAISFFQTLFTSNDSQMVADQSTSSGADYGTDNESYGIGDLF